MVVCPSDYMEADDYAENLRAIRAWGLDVELSPHALSRVEDFKGGPATHRAFDLREVIFDRSVEAVWFGIGGYAANEVLPVFLNPEVRQHLQQHPKLFIGFSDSTLLLNALHSMGIPSVMGPNFSNMTEWSAKTWTLMRKLLFGEPLMGLGPSVGWSSLSPGSASGRLLASNLETLVLTFGSLLDPLAAGDDDLILCLEDVRVQKSLVARMLDTVFLHRKAHRIKGLVFGRFTDLNPEVEYVQWDRRTPIADLLTHRAQRLHLPAAQCHAVGHQEPDRPYKENLPLPNGVKVILRSTNPCAIAFPENLTR